MCKIELNNKEVGLLAFAMGVASSSVKMTMGVDIFKDLTLKIEEQLKEYKGLKND